MLEKLRITNWKAFEERTIEFSPGLNLFVGPNGSGKTTLLDAICLALTGDIPSKDFKALIRDNNKDAAIELDLTLAGARYSIRRRFRRDRIISAELLSGATTPTQPGWDALNSILARELKTDPVFFSRMIYMSEGEVFDYAKNPPAEALNTAIERVLGIDSLRSIEDFAERIGKSYSKSAATLRNELSMPRRLSESPSFDEKEATAEFEKNKGELEIAKRDLEKARAETEHLQSSLRNLATARKLLEILGKECAVLGIEFGGHSATAEGIQDVSKIAAEKTKKLDDYVNLVSSEKGSAEATLQYLTSVQNLLSSAVQRQATVEPPCPVCERPIDKDLAARLIEKTVTEITLSRETLAKSDTELKEGQNLLQEYRASAQRLNTAATQLAELLQTAKSIDFTLGPAQMEELSRLTALQLRKIEEEVHRLAAKSFELTDTVTKEAAMLARAEGRAELIRIREDLRKQLVQKFKGSILTEALVGSLRELVFDQRDEGIKPLYLALAELWTRWRPDNDWTVMFDTEGRIELGFRNKSLRFSQLSGGEKTVLLILSRVLMLGLLSQMDFLMIDEPLEHLDLRNRRAVLNFLVASTRCRLVHQAVVTTFEESLVRKYLDGQDTNTLYLTRPAA